MFFDNSIFEIKPKASEVVASAVYDTSIPQDFDFQSAKKYMGNELRWATLLYGEKLNCIRAIASEVYKDLQIPEREIYLSDRFLTARKVPITSPIKKLNRFVTGITAKASYNFEKRPENPPFILVKRDIWAQMARVVVPHEIRHAWQHYHENDHLSIWRDCMKNHYPYRTRPIELDANAYALQFARKHFGNYPLLRYLRFEHNMCIRDYTYRNVCDDPFPVPAREQITK